MTSGTEVGPALTEEQKYALKVMAEEETKRKSTVSTIVQDIKCSEFFKENWDVLLIAAPSAIEILGNLNAVAATKWAVQTKIVQPKDGFEHLTNQPDGMNYLQAALADLSNQSEESFSVARMKMFSVTQDSDAVAGVVIAIINALKDPDAPMDEIYLFLDDLTTAANNCKSHALAVQTSMSEFKEMAAELYVACKAESADIQTQHAKAATKKELADKEVKAREEQEKLAKEHMDKMGKQMDDAQKTFKETLDKMPTGMDLVGQQILMGLGEALGNALTIGASVAANAAATAVNPAGTASKIIGDLKEIQKDNDPRSKKSKSKKETTTKGKSTEGTQAPAQEEPAETKDTSSGVLASLTKTFVRRAKPKEDESGAKSTPPAKDAKTSDEKDAAKKPADISYGNWDLSGKFLKDDPALTVIAGVKGALDSIREVIVGSPKGINWDAAKPPADTKDGTVSLLATNSHTLGRLRKDFRPKADGLASKLTIAIINEGIQIVDELEAEYEKSFTIGSGEKVDRKSDVYKDWDDRTAHLVYIATTLTSATNSQPGNPIGGASSLFAPPAQTPEEKIAAMEHKTAVADATVRLASAKLKATQEAYQTSLTTYQESANRVLDIQDNLMKTRLEIESLKVQQLTLEGIKVVLVRCIAFLEDLKIKIDSLVQFFHRLAEVIRVCIQFQVDPFKKRIELYGKKNDKAVFYEQYMRDTIFKFALQILAKFSLFRDVAKMYIAVDEAAIKPGLILVNEVGSLEAAPGKTEDQIFELRKKRMKEYSQDAQATVKTVVQKQQQLILSTLQSRVSGISESLARFPVKYHPDEKATKAIQGGAELTKATNAEEVKKTTSRSNVSKVMSKGSLDIGDVSEF
ncbi:hypothetical protein TWF506_008666 [Arthrobotrys conoides]|uniref:Uncharacterized protein n=1 Tax=Arthrobotrys conoides TaxID=74498 RepID=A0AAN8NWG6_9PEZI